MSSNKPIKDPAFPLSYQFYKNREHYVNFDYGMSKRFYAACAAMQGMLASYAGMQIKEFPCEWIVSESYKIADELLKRESDAKP